MLRKTKALPPTHSGLLHGLRLVEVELRALFMTCAGHWSRASNLKQVEGGNFA